MTRPTLHFSQRDELASPGHDARPPCLSPPDRHTVIVVYDTETAMFLHVDPDNGLAIYDQIVRQIKFAVATGALPPGELAPSVRELARELAVNLNTVSKAYQHLQAEGVLENV